MPEYKLYYFNGRGRAEVARWLFSYAEVPFEDVRYSEEEWPAAKAKLNAPFGQLPSLSIDGTLYSQSLSIFRYLAEKFGLAGKTDLEKLRADMIAHCAEDYAQAVFRAYFEEPDEAKKAELQQKLRDGGLNTYFTYLENILKQNKGGDGYFVGDSLTYADLVVTHYAEYVGLVGLDYKQFLSGFPKLKALYDKVLKEPKIAAWIAKSPQTPW